VRLPWLGPAVRLAAAASGGRPGGRASCRGDLGAAAGGAVRGFGEGGAVGEDGVELPAFAARGGADPEFVLGGVAAGGSALVGGGKAGLGEAPLLGVDRAGGADLDAQVVQGSAVPGVSSKTSLSGGSAIAKFA
jgi:hypothetical protein